LELDPESRAWVDALGSRGSGRAEAIGELHGILVRAARFRLAHRSSSVHLRGETVDDVATEAADDALIAILGRLHEFRGASRFTTWACKFVMFEASVALRKREWKGRELPTNADEWLVTALAHGPAEKLEQLELLRRLRQLVNDALTERQRMVFVAIALNGTPIDVVANELGTTRGAVYKTLHDARRKLRAGLEQHRRHAGASGS
jgi:RNA polymerase sigma-70 factor (ECF subfamily)